MLSKLRCVSIYPESRLSAEDVLELGYPDVVIATGSHWRRDGVGAMGEEPVPLDGAAVLTPEDVFAGAVLAESVVIYDDEHYAVGGALAERLAGEEKPVTLVTPAPMVSSWTQMTDEQHFIQARLIGLGVKLVLSRRLLAARAGEIDTACVYTGARETMTFGSLVLVTGRVADGALHEELSGDPGRLEASGIRSLIRIGDCLAPSSIADAVFSGHRYAREFDEPRDHAAPRRERPPA
jgi:dimethylamine/trimethylamine dehydrogenase